MLLQMLPIRRLFGAEARLSCDRRRVAAGVTDTVAALLPRVRSISTTVSARVSEQVRPSGTSSKSREIILPSIIRWIEPIALHRVLHDGSQSWFEARLPFSRGHDIPVYYTEELVSAVSTFILSDPTSAVSSAGTASATSASGRASESTAGAGALASPAPHHLMLLGGTKSSKSTFTEKVLPRRLAAAYASPEWDATRSGSDSGSGSGGPSRPRPIIIPATLAPLCALTSAGCLHSALQHGARTQGIDVPDLLPARSKPEPQTQIAIPPGVWGAPGWHVWDPVRQRAYDASVAAAKLAEAERERAGTIDTLPQLFLQVALAVRAAGGEPWFVIDNIDEPMLSGAGSTPADAARFGVKLAEVSQTQSLRGC